jgi:maltose O-acetyltransferase
MIDRILSRLKDIVQKSELKKITFGTKGKDVVIKSPIMVSNAKNIHIEDNVYIGRECKFFGQAPITIGKGTIFADNIEIRTANHYYDGEDLKYIPYDERVICKSVKIGENVWVGTKVLILPGVSIGEGAVIGAGSVITKDVPVCAVVGGNPAKILKYRDTDIYHKLKNDNQRYMIDFNNIKPKHIYEIKGEKSND